MKPSRWIVTSLVGTSVCLPLVSIATEDLGGSASTEVLLASLPQRNDRVWVQVLRPVSNEELALQLGLDESQLAHLNDTDEDHRWPFPSARPARPVASPPSIPAPCNTPCPYKLRLPSSPATTRRARWCVSATPLSRVPSATA